MINEEEQDIKMPHEVNSMPAKNGKASRFCSFTPPSKKSILSASLQSPCDNLKYANTTAHLPHPNP